MTLQTGSNTRGVTLIELILVMGLLTTVAALTAPHLSDFLGGRSLQAECTRFIALTRHARSEAISQGATTEIWLDSEAGQYGMRVVTSSENTTPQLREYTLGRGLHFEFEADSVIQDGLQTIPFRPDGTLDSVAMERFWIMRGSDDGYQIALDESRAKYEIIGRDEPITHATVTAR